MKSIHYISILLILSMTAMWSCKEEETTPAAEEVQNQLIEALQGTWIATEVRKENTVITDFNNFTITITDQSYNTENGAPVWPASGTFDFTTAETEDEFLRQDGRLFTATTSASSVTITIIYNEETGRGEYGTYEFEMEQE